MQVSRVESLSKLCDKTPEQLCELAEEIFQDHTPSKAMDEMDRKPEEHRDEQKRQVIQWNHDILEYIVLNRAIRYGDVGLMEDMLPHLLFRFMGGDNSKYAIEMVELLQGLHREWPPEIKSVSTISMSVY